MDQALNMLYDRVMTKKNVPRSPVSLPSIFGETERSYVDIKFFCILICWSISHADGLYQAIVLPGKKTMWRRKEFLGRFRPSNGKCGGFGYSPVLTLLKGVDRQ